MHRIAVEVPCHPGTVAAAPNKPVVAAVAGSSNAREVRDALIHEAMHMIFYTDDLYAGKCYEFWDSGKISDAEKEAWVTFLRDLQYNVVGKRCAAERVLCFFVATISA